MRLRHHSTLVILVVMFVALPSLAVAAQDSAGKLASGELVERPAEYDGKRITFVGEAVGEFMRRGESGWIHVNDDAYMLLNVEEGAELQGYNSGMSVWLSRDFASKIAVYGDYKHEGDVVQLTGIFNAACAQHGGDMDIHAEDLVVVSNGHPASDPIHRWKIWLALGLTVTSTLLWLIQRRQHTRELKGWLASGTRRG